MGYVLYAGVSVTCPSNDGTHVSDILSNVRYFTVKKTHIVI